MLIFEYSHCDFNDILLGGLSSEAVLYPTGPSLSTTASPSPSTSASPTSDSPSQSTNLSPSDSVSGSPIPSPSMPCALLFLFFFFAFELRHALPRLSALSVCSSMFIDVVICFPSLAPALIPFRRGLYRSRSKASQCFIKRDTAGLSILGDIC